jgi:hypothetical protein
MLYSLIKIYQCFGNENSSQSPPQGPQTFRSLDKFYDTFLESFHCFFLWNFHFSFSILLSHCWQHFSSHDSSSGQVISSGTYFPTLHHRGPGSIHVWPQCTPHLTCGAWSGIGTGFSPPVNYNTTVLNKHPQSMTGTRNQHVTKVQRHCLPLSCNYLCGLCHLPRLRHPSLLQ